MVAFGRQPPNADSIPSSKPHDWHRQHEHRHARGEAGSCDGSAVPVLYAGRSCCSGCFDALRTPDQGYGPSFSVHYRRGSRIRHWGSQTSGVLFPQCALTCNIASHQAGLSVSLAAAWKVHELPIGHHRSCACPVILRSRSKSPDRVDDNTDLWSKNETGLVDQSMCMIINGRA